MHPEVTAYLAEIGSKGGKTVTDRKRQALKANASKPRPNRKPKLWPYQIRAIEKTGECAIYVLKNPQGVVLYVGQTIDPYSRLYTLRGCRKDIPKPFELVVLAWTTKQEANRIETETIESFWKIGEANFNKHTPINLNKPPSGQVRTK